jgi:NAD(P)-dependent dehydrogenase (short-subunit alcohol dehydrogenase family)
VSRIFITGSTDGLGRGAATVLMGDGHDVVLHARTRQRAAALSGLAADAAKVVIGDLASVAETRALADQVNGIGRMETVIHNAGVFLEPSRSATADGHPTTLAVNTLAPYLLTALIDRPHRVIYLSSGLHHTGAGSLADIDWTRRPWNPMQAYAERASCTSPRSRSPWPVRGRKYSATPSIRAGSRPRWAAPQQPATWSWDTSPRHGSPSATTQPPP